MAEFVFVGKSELIKTPGVYVQFSVKVDRDYLKDKTYTTVYIKRDYINTTSSTKYVVTYFFGQCRSDLYTYEFDGTDKVINWDRTVKANSTYTYTERYHFNWDGFEKFTMKVGVTEGVATSNGVTEKPSQYSIDVKDWFFTEITVPPPFAKLVIPNYLELGQPFTLNIDLMGENRWWHIQYNMPWLVDNLDNSFFNTAESITHTFPLDFANNSTRSDGIPTRFILNVYEGFDENSKLLGYVNFDTVVNLPEWMKPNVSMTVTDLLGHFEKYGAYVQGKSSIRVDMTAEESYGAEITIKDIRVGAQWASVIPSDFLLLDSGEKTVIARAVDTRNRTGVREFPITILPYISPVVIDNQSFRCLEDGTANLEGSFAKIIFSASVCHLNDKNSAMYVMQFREKWANEWTDIPFSQLSGNYDPVDASIILSAEPLKQYEYRFCITDDFGTSYSNIFTIYPASALLEVDATGTGMAIGQMANEPGLFRVNLPTFFNHDVDVSGGIHAENHVIGISEVWTDSDKKSAYVLFENGFLMQWLNATFNTIAINQQVGSLYYVTIKYTFKQPFSTNNAIVIPTVSSSCKNVWASVQEVTETYAKVSFISDEVIPSGTGLTLKVIALGY